MKDDIDRLTDGRFWLAVVTRSRTERRALPTSASAIARIITTDQSDEKCNQRSARCVSSPIIHLPQFVYAGLDLPVCNLTSQ